MLRIYYSFGLPVHASDIDVIRATRARFKADHRAPRKYRDGRHATYKVMLGYHQRGKALYRYATGGQPHA